MVSLIPGSAIKGHVQPTDLKLFAANSTVIKTYGMMHAVDPSTLASAVLSNGVLSWLKLKRQF